MDQSNPIQLPQQDPSFQVSPIQLPPEGYSHFPSPNTAEDRSTKAAFGLSPFVKMDKPSIHEQISQGKEPDFRSRASYELDAFNRRIAQQAFVDHVKNNTDLSVDPSFVKSLLNPPTSDPDTVIEKAFANAYVAPFFNPKDPFASFTFMQDMHKEPEKVDTLRALTASVIAKDQYYKSKMQDLEDTYQGQSWSGWTVDQIKNMFQPYVEIKMRGLTDQASGIAEGLLGTTLKAEADDINRLPLEQAKPKLDAILEKLKNDNPTLAIKFMNYVMHSHDENPVFDNLWSSLLIAGGIGSAVKGTVKGGFKGLQTIVGAGARRTSAVRQMYEMYAANAGKDLVRSARDAGGTDRTIEDIARWENEGGAVAPEVQRAAAAGDLAEAAVKQAAIDVTGPGISNPTQRALDALPSMFQKLKDKFFDVGIHGKDLKNRLLEDMNRLLDPLVKEATGGLRIDPFADIAQNEEAVRKIKELTVNSRPELSGRVLDVSGFIWDPATRSHSVNILVGQNDGQLFQKMGQLIEEAKELGINLTHDELEPLPTETLPDGRVIKGWPIGGIRKKQRVYGADVGQQGGRFYISMNVPIDTTQPIIRQLYGQTANSKSPWSVLRAYTSWISTGEDTQSFDQRAAKQIATYGPDKIYDIFKENAKNLKKLSRSQANDLERILEDAQQKPDPKNYGISGKFYDTVTELDDAYLRLIGHMPEDNEIVAYYTFRNYYEADRWFRIASKATFKNRVGGREVTISVKGLDRSEEVNSPPFEARRLTSMPIGTDNSILVIKDKIDHSLINSSEELAANQKQWNELNEKVKTGAARVWEIIDPDTHPLEGFAGVEQKHRIRYVVAYRTADGPIDLKKQVPRQGGGHLLRDHPFYASQARTIFNPVTKKWDYVGDTNLFGMDVKAMGKDVIHRLNHIQGMVAAKASKAEIHDFVNSNPIPLDLDKLLADYEPTMVNGKKVPPRLNVHEPIQVRPENKSLIDLGEHAVQVRYRTPEGQSTLIDRTRQGSLARQMSVQFTGERDAYEFHRLEDRGTKFNPLYSLEKSKIVDAIPMMQRALGQIINSTFMDDYRTSAVEHWLFGASVYDDISGKMVGAADFMRNKDAVLHSPFYYFEQPDWKPGTPIQVKSALLADRMKIRMFTGTPSKVETALHSLEQQTADAIYGKFGAKAMKLAPLWQFSSLTQAPRLLRSILYNTKMGFFSPRQFLIHAFTFINAALITPRYAGSGAYGAMMHGWASLNASEDFLKILDNRISKFKFPGQAKWNPGEWKEAREALIRSNFQHVESSQLALVDNPMANNLIQNKGEAFLNAGTSPFRAGVKALKTASWYTAFKEWRDLHPVGKVTDNDIGMILNRANDLSHNMSRASTSSIQKGFMTFGAMFSSYNLRLAELLIGKRLTRPERARLFFGYMTLFGVPTAGGIFGLDTMTRNQVYKGNVPGLQTYVPGYDFTTTAIMEGLLPAVIGSATGGGDIQKGNIYDIGESYGAKDLGIVESTLNGDRTMWDFFLGAAGSTIGNTWASSSPFRKAMMDIAKGEDAYKVTADDWIGLFKEISTVNYVYRGYMALEFGKWMSRNGAYLEPVSAGNAIFMSITGLANQAVPDVYHKSLVNTELREAEAQSFRQYSKVMQQYFQAVDSKNESLARQLGKNASILLSMIPTQDQGRAMSQAYKDNQSLVDRMDWTSVNARYIPDQTKDINMQKLMKIQELKAKQGIQ